MSGIWSTEQREVQKNGGSLLQTRYVDLSLCVCVSVYSVYKHRHLDQITHSQRQGLELQAVNIVMFFLFIPSNFDLYSVTFSSFLLFLVCFLVF